MADPAQPEKATGSVCAGFEQSVGERPLRLPLSPPLNLCICSTFPLSNATTSELAETRPLRSRL